MPVTVTRTQIRSILAGPEYRVQDTCDSATGISNAIYVFAVSNDSFLNVATVHDIVTYPVGRAAAIAAGQDRYRLIQVTRGFAVLDTAIEFAASLKIRAQALCRAYDAATAEFQGSTTETVSSAVAT